MAPLKTEGPDTRCNIVRNVSYKTYDGPLLKRATSDF